MVNLRFMRLTHAGGTIYNAGEVAAFPEATAHTIMVAGHAVDHDAPLGPSETPAAADPTEQEPVQSDPTEQEPVKSDPIEQGLDETATA